MSGAQTCECGSGQPYESCCGQYHRGTVEAPTAEALLRARYTAYVRRIDAYLARTWHRENRPADATPENPALKWLGLEILKLEHGTAADNRGVIEFVARYSVGGRQEQLHERSCFVREAGLWYYVDGDDLPPVGAVGHKTGRNDPCPCGSGKKYKKCCGQ